MVSRCMILLRICNFRGVMAVLEQPASSVMQCAQYVYLHCCPPPLLLLLLLLLQLLLLLVAGPSGAAWPLRC